MRCNQMLCIHPLVFKLLNVLHLLQWRRMYLSEIYSHFRLLLLSIETRRKRTLRQMMISLKTIVYTRFHIVSIVASIVAHCC